MKKLAPILIIAFVFIISSCRKDPPLVGLEPMGNTLVMQLGDNYEIDGATELTLDVNYLENILDLTYDADPGAIPSKIVIQFLTSQDTILFFRDNKLITPALDTSRLLSRDGRLFTKITADDFIPFLSSKFDTDQLIPSVGDCRLLHDYFNQSTGKKISVYTTLLYVYNAEFQISVPYRKYFLMVGL